MLDGPCDLFLLPCMHAYACAFTLLIHIHLLVGFHTFPFALLFFLFRVRGQQRARSCASLLASLISISYDR